MEDIINNKNQHLFVVNNISKQIEDDQYEVLINLVKRAQWSNMLAVEIGSWTGTSAVLIGTVVKRMNGRLYSIDPYLGASIGQEHLKTTAEKINVREIFIKNMNIFELSDTVLQIKESSIAASKRVLNETVDFIFIDGDHSYEAVQNDIRTWWPKLKCGAIMCGHDYYGQVEKAVNDLLPNAKSENRIWSITKTCSNLMMN